MLGSPRRRLPGSRQARLSVAAFGKHPAWRDHIDEDVLIAAPTDELRLLEGWLHGDTFEEFTSKSAINKLSPDNLIPFDHLIVRSGPAGCSLTRLWASTDYSGRAQFPMAISVDADGFGVDDALRRILPALDACAARVREIGTALRDRIDKEDGAHSGSLDVAPARKAVRDAVEALRQQLGVVASAPAEKDPDAGALLRELRAHQDSGPGGQGLARVMYRLERLKPSDGGSRSTTRSQAARRWRLPRAAEADDQSVRRWLAFLSFIAPDLSMITLALPQGRAWVDLFVGDVGMGELERMRLSESAESIESRTTYSAVNSAYISAADATMDGWLREGPRPAQPPPPAPPAERAPGAAPEKKGFGRRWRDWLIGGGGVIALAALVGFLVSGRGQKPAAAPASVTPSVAQSAPEPSKSSSSASPALPREPAAKPAPALTEPAQPTASTASPITPAPTPEPTRAQAPEPVHANIGAEVDAAKFTLGPLTATWNASVGEAKRSTDPPDEVRTRLDLIRRGLEEIERVLAFPPDASEPAAASDAARKLWEPKATAIASELAGTAVRDARAGHSLSRENVQTAAAELTGALNAARERGGALARAASELRAGKSIGQIRPDGLPKTPSAIDPEWAAVAGLIAGDAPALLKEASEISKDSSIDRLLRVAGGPSQTPLGTANTAWDRLEELAPRLTSGQVETIPAALQALEARTAPGDSSAHNAARDRASRIVGARLARAPMDDTMAMACARVLDAIGAAGSGGSLPPIAAANLALAKLKAAAPNETDAAQLRAKVVALRTDHNISISLPDANPQSQRADPELFRTVGPAAKGWTVALSPDLEQATYTLGKLTLKFQRIPTASDVGGGAAYLCTTELSVAVMLDTLERSKDWDVFAQLIALPGSDGEDPRAGIRTWHFGRRELSHLQPARFEGRPDPKAWLNASCTYPEDATPPAPTSNSPAQYLSFAAAVHIAAALGCRLPSSAEWLAAARRIPDATRGWNRRDATWLRYAQYYAQHPCPAGAAAAESFRTTTGDQTRAAVTEDDGVLWLADVDSGPDVPFRHLIGNVAEWCFEGPAVLDARLSDHPQLGTLSTKDCRIIGGSALSEPDIDPMKPYPVSDVDAGAPLGFSDVGVRLAFSSPVGRAGTELHQIRQAIFAAPYLVSQ